MDSIIEYFTRHYTLVLDNDQGTYNAVREIIGEILSESDTTLTDYRAMSDDERSSAFAEALGSRVLDMIEEWYLDEIKEQDSAGAKLIREIMITNGSSLAWELGKHYLPENDDAAEFLSDDDEDI
jgi:hypothetical protein